MTGRLWRGRIHSIRWLVCLLLSAAGTTAEADGAGGTVSGFVRDRADGEVLMGASVFIGPLQIGTTTNDRGYFLLGDVPAGRWPLTVSFIGYQIHQQVVELNQEKALRLDILLQDQILETVETLVRADSLGGVGDRSDLRISTVHLAPRDIDRLPQVAEADVLRSLQSLPGVLPLSDFSSALYVRGGTPDQNLYLVDGAEIYNPEHALGIFSTFNTDAIKRVELSKGGFGAEYGGRLSSVLDVVHLDGNRRQFEGVMAISLLSAKSTLQVPLGQKGSLSGSLRRTYFDRTVGRWLDSVPDYYFYDGHLKAHVDLGPSDALTLSFFAGRDVLDVTFSGPSQDESGYAVSWRNQTGSARYTHVFSPRIFANFWLTHSRFLSNFAFDESGMDERSSLTDVSLRGHLEFFHSQHLRVEWGAEVKKLAARFSQDFLSGRIDVRDRPLHGALYGTIDWQPLPGRLTLRGGMRYGRFAARERTLDQVEPRLALTYRLGETHLIKVATGVHTQYVHRVPRFVAADIWTTANAFQRGAQAVHYMAGYARDMGRSWQFEVEFFYKDYDSLYQFNQNYLTEVRATRYDELDRPIIDTTQGLFLPGRGHVTGVEALLRKERGVVSGWLGGALARTRYAFDAINRGRPFAPRHDRTFAFNAVGHVDMGGALRWIRRQLSSSGQGPWSMGFHLFYATGQPITEPGSAYVASIAPNDANVGVFYAPTRINGARLPYYARLDLSLEWRGELAGWRVVPYLQIFNVGNRRNAWYVEYDFSSSQPKVEQVGMFPILPSVGLRVQF